MTDPTMAGPALPGAIPIRNIWFLLVYAWDMAKVSGRFDAAVEALDEDAPLASLIACLLCAAVTGRLRRNLSQGYVPRTAVLSRVRGRIDVFKTQTQRLLETGQVACRFSEMTSDTPRNRYVRAALVHLAAVGLPPPLKMRCTELSRALAAAGVGCERASARSLAAEQFGRNDAQDRLMLEAARLAFNLALPTETTGPRATAQAERAEAWLRRLFERAVGGFYKAHLPSAEGWAVRPGRSLDWERSNATHGIAALLPKMTADITIDHHGKRLVIDTKFTDAVQSNRWGKDVFKSAHIYQIYAYLRSQAHRNSPEDDGAAGMLLYPTIAVQVEEAVTIQGHIIRFASVDLNASPQHIAARLLRLAGYAASASSIMA